MSKRKGRESEVTTDPSSDTSTDRTEDIRWRLTAKAHVAAAAAAARVCATDPADRAMVEENAYQMTLVALRTAARARMRLPDLPSSPSKMMRAVESVVDEIAARP